jgi:hypothetical protein
MKSGLGIMPGALLAIHRSEVRLNGTVELIALVGDGPSTASAGALSLAFRTSPPRTT